MFFIAAALLSLPPIMDHPFMDPNDCPWTEEYRDNWRLRKRYNMITVDEDSRSRYWCDENADEYEDALYNI